MWAAHAETGVFAREETMAEDHRPSPRKPYQPPRLTDYGRVCDLTKGTGIGRPDNGITPSHAKYKS